MRIYRNIERITTKFCKWYRKLVLRYELLPWRRNSYNFNWSYEPTYTRSKCCILEDNFILFMLFYATFNNISFVKCMLTLIMNSGASWSWSYGRWIYNYLCNRCLSPLKLWVQIPLRWGVLDTTLCYKVCQLLVQKTSLKIWTVTMKMQFLQF
jgi:hypothetical protein